MTSTNDGKDVKSNQTSGQKGKKYYLELYNSLEERLSGSESLAERAQYLCEAWRRIHNICRHAASPSHPILLAWLERHTASVTLQSQWQSPDSEAKRTAFDDTLVSVAQEIDSYVSERDGCRLPWEELLLRRLEWYRSVLDNPWGHPVLKTLLNPEETQPDEETIIEWLRGEREAMFVRRVHELVASKKCIDMAISLVAAVMDRRRAASAPLSDLEQAEEQRDASAPEQTEATFENILRRQCGFTDEGWGFLTDVEFALLLKADQMTRFFELAKLTPLKNGYELIDSLQNRLRKAKTSREKKMWKNVNDVAILIAQIMIARCMVIPTCSGAVRSALYKCAHALCALLPSERVKKDMVTLAVPAVTAAHLYTLAKAVHKQRSSEDMKPFVCELYVRAITSGMNELEKLKLMPDKEKEARQSEQTLASWFLELGGVFSSPRLRGECSLTAFSVHPSLEMYERIKATPELPPVRIAEQLLETKVEPTSEFGSWACDSRSQTNFVKTSEHLNMKQTQQANVLSTAILNEGEALGLGMELCQDIAVLLSGPRVKTLSWDLDRELLLANCRLHIERTAGGTRALTTELRFLHLDPKDYQHLREEDDDDENDLYYGIEKGYEHLVEFPEPQPEAIWEDDLIFADERTESAYSTDSEDHAPNSRKKKTKKFSYASCEDEDPLSIVAETKRKEQRKERPHSKERSKGGSDIERNNKERKKKPKKERSHSKDKEKKKKKERKKKIKEEVTGPLSHLVGVKVEKHDFVDSSYDGNSSLSALFADPSESHVEYDGQFSMDELKSPERKSTTPPKVLGSTVYTNQTPIKQEKNEKSAENPNISPINPEVKRRVAELINFRRNKSTASTESSNSPTQSPVSHLILPKEEPKVKTEPMSNLVGAKIITPAQIPKNVLNSSKSLSNLNEEIMPKKVLNTHQSLQLSKLKEEISNLLKTCTSPVQSTQCTDIKNYANKTINKVTYEPANMRETCSRMVPVKSYSKNRVCSIPQLQLNYLENLSRSEGKQTQIMPQLKQPHVVSHVDKYHNSPQEKIQNSTRQSVDHNSPEKPWVSHQRSFEDFVKDLQYSINAGLGTNTTKERISRAMKPMKTKVTPVIPNILKCSRTAAVISNVPNVASTSFQSAKPVVQHKKTEDTPNTFSRRSYMHKSKQNDSKPESSLEQNQVALENQAALERSVSEEIDKRIANLSQYKMSMKGNQTSVSINKVINSDGVYTNPKESTKVEIIKLAPPHPSITDNHPVLQTSDVENVHRKIYQAPKTKPTKTKTVLKSALSEKDQQDLINMLRQQNKLNEPLLQTKTNVTAMLNNLQSNPAITIMNTNSTVSTSNQSIRPVSNQVVSQPQNLLNQNQTTTQTERKDFNAQLISRATILKTADLIHSRIMSSQAKADAVAVQSKFKTNDAINKSFDTIIKPKPVQTEVVLQSTPAATTLANASQDIVRIVKRPAKLSSVEKKYESTKKNWTCVMDALRKHKTPSRGPSALGMVLDNDAYEKYGIQSLRNQRIVRPKSEQNNQQIVNKQDMRNQRIVKPKSEQNNLQIANKQDITKSIQTPKPAETILKVSTQSLQPTESTQPKIQINIEYANNQPVVKITKETPLSQTLNCETLREDDPFISGILNSEYELLEELMDDDLRKEIGELSSDEERSYTTPIITKNSKKNTIKSGNNIVDESLSSVTNTSNNPIKSKDLCETSNRLIEKFVPNSNKTIDVKQSNSISKAKPQILSHEKVNIIRRSEIIQQFSKKIASQISQPKPGHARTNISNQNSANIDTNKMIITVPPEPSSNIVVIRPDMPYEPYPTLHIKEAAVDNNINQSYVEANNTHTVNNIKLTPVVAPVIVNRTIGLSTQMATVSYTAPYNEVKIQPNTIVPTNKVLIKQTNTPTKIMEINAAPGSNPSSVPNKIVQNSGMKKQLSKTKIKKTIKSNATILRKTGSGKICLPKPIQNADNAKVCTWMKLENNTSPKIRPEKHINSPGVKVDAFRSEAPQKTIKKVYKLPLKIVTPTPSNNLAKLNTHILKTSDVKLDREVSKKDEIKLQAETKLPVNVTNSHTLKAPDVILDREVSKKDETKLQAETEQLSVNVIPQMHILKTLDVKLDRQVNKKDETKLQSTIEQLSVNVIPQRHTLKKPVGKPDREVSKKDEIKLQAETKLPVNVTNSHTLKTPNVILDREVSKKDETKLQAETEQLSVNVIPQMHILKTLDVKLDRVVTKKKEIKLQVEPQQLSVNVIPQMHTLKTPDVHLNKDISNKDTTKLQAETQLSVNVVAQTQTLKITDVKLDKEVSQKYESKLQAEPQQLSGDANSKSAPVLIPKSNDTSQKREIPTPEIQTKPEIKVNNMELGKSCERKVLSEVQEKLTIPSPEKVESKLTRTPRLSTENDKSIEDKKEKERMYDRERLKRKRLAIINREISHRCFDVAIALPYAPIQVQSLKTPIEKPINTEVLNDLSEKANANQQTHTNSPIVVSQLSEFTLLNSSTPESPGNIENTVQNINGKSKGKATLGRVKKSKNKKGKMKKEKTADNGIKTDHDKREIYAMTTLNITPTRVSSRIREKKKKESVSIGIDPNCVVKQSSSSETQQIAVTPTDMTNDVQPEALKKSSIPEITTPLEYMKLSMSEDGELVSTLSKVSSSRMVVEPTKPTQKLDTAKSTDGQFQKEVIQILSSPEDTPDELSYPDVKKVTNASKEFDYKDTSVKILKNADNETLKSVASTIQPPLLSLVPKLITNLGDTELENDPERSDIVSTGKSVNEENVEGTEQKKLLNVISLGEDGKPIVDTIDIASLPVLEKAVTVNNDECSDTDIIPIDSDDTDHNEDFNSQLTKNTNDMDKTEDIPQAYKNSIIFEELPSPNPNDPSMRCVRVQIPNGKTFKATIFGQMKINFDTLFENPALKQVLLSGISDKKRFTFSVQQIATANNEIIDTRVKFGCAPHTKVGNTDVVNLISDDEDDENDVQISEKSIQKFTTQFGTYPVKSMEEDTYKKHQSKLSQKCLVKLEKCDAKVSKPAIKFQKPTREKLNHLIDDAVLNPNLEENNEILPLQEVLFSDSSKRLVPTGTEVINLDDSSDEETPSKIQSIDEIDELKNLLLKDLGIADSLDDNTISGMDAEKSSPRSKRSKSQKKYKAYRESIKKDYSEIIPYKCFVKLTRCDSSVGNLKKENYNNFEPKLSRSGSFSILNDFDDDDVIELTESESERSSPVIDTIQTITALHGTLETDRCIIHNSVPTLNTQNYYSYKTTLCYSDWFDTKKDIQRILTCDLIPESDTNADVIDNKTDVCDYESDSDITFCSSNISDPQNTSVTTSSAVPSLKNIMTEYYVQDSVLNLNSSMSVCKQALITCKRKTKDEHKEVASKVSKIEESLYDSQEPGTGATESSNHVDSITMSETNFKQIVNNNLPISEQIDERSRDLKKDETAISRFNDIILKKIVCDYIVNNIVSVILHTKYSIPIEHKPVDNKREISELSNNEDNEVHVRCKDENIEVMNENNTLLVQVNDTINLECDVRHTDLSKIEVNPETVSHLLTEEQKYTKTEIAPSILQKVTKTFEEFKAKCFLTNNETEECDEMITLDQISKITETTVMSTIEFQTKSLMQDDQNVDTSISINEALNGTDVEITNDVADLHVIQKDLSTEVEEKNLLHFENESVTESHQKLGSKAAETPQIPLKSTIKSYSNFKNSDLTSTKHEHTANSNVSNMSADIKAKTTMTLEYHSVPDYSEEIEHKRKKTFFLDIPVEYTPDINDTNAEIMKYTADLDGSQSDVDAEHHLVSLENKSIPKILENLRIKPAEIPKPVANWQNSSKVSANTFITKLEVTEDTAELFVTKQDENVDMECQSLVVMAKITDSSKELEVRPDQMIGILESSLGTNCEIISLSSEQISTDCHISRQYVMPDKEIESSMTTKNDESLEKIKDKPCEIIYSEVHSYIDMEKISEHKSDTTFAITEDTVDSAITRQGVRVDKKETMDNKYITECLEHHEDQTDLLPVTSPRSSNRICDTVNLSVANTNENDVYPNFENEAMISTENKSKKECNEEFKGKVINEPSINRPASLETQKCNQIAQQKFLCNTDIAHEDNIAKILKTENIIPVKCLEDNVNLTALGIKGDSDEYEVNKTLEINTVAECKNQEGSKNNLGDDTTVTLSNAILPTQQRADPCKKPLLSDIVRSNIECKEETSEIILPQEDCENEHVIQIVGDDDIESDEVQIIEGRTLTVDLSKYYCETEIVENGSIESTIESPAVKETMKTDEDEENMSNARVSMLYRENAGGLLKGVEYDDPVLGTYYLFAVENSSDFSTNNSNTTLVSVEDTQINENDDEISPAETKQETDNNFDYNANMEVMIPKQTYSRRNLKRKLVMNNMSLSVKKRRFTKLKSSIESRKLSNRDICDSLYVREFTKLLDYCSNINFSYSVSFHKEQVDVENILNDWPIKGDALSELHDPKESDGVEVLFTDLDGKPPFDPLTQTLSEELSIEYVYKESCEADDSNFNMGFGERSGRVNQNFESGGVTKFSAATLSDVKRSQPFLIFKDQDDCCNENILISREKDQIQKIKRAVTYIQLRDKVRSFFAKSAIELACDIGSDKYKENPIDSATFPFDLFIPKSFQPALVDVVVQVVQVGQLPVSAAAQNPVTCDPRVTQVSDASPSQCSEENSPRDDSQQGIKTEYTELTTADLSMPMETYQNHNQTVPIENQEARTGDNIPIETELIKSEVKIELVEETSEDSKMDEKMDDASELPTSNHSNSINYTYETNNMNASMEQDTNMQMIQPMQDMYSQQKQQNGAPEKTDQIAHAMSAAGISTTAEPVQNARAQALVNIISQKIRHSNGNTAQNSINTYSKSSPITAMALQQALAQILPPPLNQTNAGENNQQGQNSTVTPQVLHIVQGKNASGNQITLVDNSQQSVINQNATPVLHIVQNKGPTSAPNSSGNTAQQQNAFSGLSLVDTGLQQGGNQLLHIVNTGNQKNTNAAQLLKRVNLLTNLTNVPGSNDQKMVQFLCKSADGKSIQLNAPHQRSMVLRLQPIESPNEQLAQPKPTENQDMAPSSNTPNSEQNKDSGNSQQEIKSRSIYEENYAKFIQSSTVKPVGEKSTSLPKFNQAFGKSSFQDGNQKQTEISANTHLPPSVNTNNDNTECSPADNNSINLDHISQISSPPLLLRKSPQTSQSQQNLVQQIKQNIAPVNIQTMHGGVIYTRQIPVNIGGGQTINLITVPSTELIDDKQRSEVKFVNQGGEIEPSIIKIVPQSQPAPNAEVTQDESNNHVNINNDNAQNPQPQPVLTQMRIKLPMLSKTPQVVSGARVVRPSFFQIQRNIIGGANQQVYQQLVLTATPPLGQQTIRLPQAQAARPVKVPSETQSSPESQMSSSTLEQLREFDMVLEQVKERSTVQPNLCGFKVNTASSDTTDSNVSGSSTSVETTQPVLYSIGGSQQLNVAYVNRKAVVATPSTSTFVRSPDSSSIADSPGSSNQAQTSQSVSSEPSSSGTSSQSRPKVSSKSKSRPKSSHSQVKINSVPPKPTTQKPLEDEQTTQRILYILAEYKEQVENSPDKDKPAPRRRSNPPSNPGSSKRKKSSSGSRRPGARDVSPIQGDDTCRTMGSEDSSCGTSQGDCTDSCMETHSPQDSPQKVARKLTFEQESAVNQPRPQPQRNLIVADGQAITVARGAGGKPATAVLMPANYILPVSMVKGGQQIAIVTNRGPKLLTVGGGESGGTNALLLQRLIGPAGLKPVLARPGVRHVRLPTAALHNLQTFNLAPAATVQPHDSTASPAPAPTPPGLIETRAENSPWTERESESVRPVRPSSPEGSEPWNIPTSSETQEYSYEETVRAENMDRTVLDPIPDRYSPDMEAQRIFDKMFDVETKKCFIVDSHDEPHCGYGVDASEDDKGYQVVQKKEGPSHRQHRVTHISAAALRHKYAILEHELRLQKSLSEECEDLGVDSPSASELFPEAELLFAASPAQDHGEASHHNPHTPQPTLLNQTAIQPDVDDQIATDQLLPREDVPRERPDLDVNLGLGDVGIVTVSEDGMQATIALDQEEFARSHPNTTFHSEPTDCEVQQPFTITGIKGGRQISTIFHANRVPATVLMTAPQAAGTVISQTVPPPASQGSIKYSQIDHMITIPGLHTNNVNLNSVLVKDDGLTRYDNILTDSRELHLSNTASAIVHPSGNATQVIRRVCYDDDKRERDARYLMDEPDTLIAGDDAKMIAEDSRDATMESMAEDVDDDNSSSERHGELFWESNSASERSESRRPLDFSSDSEKGCKSPSYDETNSTDSSGVGSHVRHDSVIKEARFGRSGSAEGSSADDTHPPLRTYPPKRTYHNTETEMERSLSGKTRAGEHSPDLVEGRRRTSVRGVVKRGCHCCNGSPTPAAPRPKKSRQRKPALDFNTNT